MELNSLTAISPIDGRYRRQVQHLADYFSEYALMKYRVLIEIEYYLFLADKKFFSISAKARKSLQDMAANFSIEDAGEIKEIEKTTNHDVKAVEYFIKRKLDSFGLNQEKEWVHFGLTSQDINNTSIPLSWKHAVECEYLPAILNLNRELSILAESWLHIPMLSRTHGQPAQPN
jgi:adenylosuccinate lyase